MKSLLVLSSILLLFLHPTHIFAHAGGGPPFVTVNGEYAQTNPYYQGTSSLNVPQDVLKTRFLPNEEITFHVDTSKLAVPASALSESTFEWILFSGDNFLDQIGTGETGRTMTHSFTKAGSYLVNVYLTYQNDPQLMDTIQIDVLPYKGYSPPTVTVSINQVGSEVNFLSDPTIDVRSQVKKSFWDLGDGKITEGNSIHHTYETANFISFLYHRIIDAHGLVTDVGFQTQAVEGKLSFLPFSNATTPPFTVTVTKIPVTFITYPTIIVLSILCLVVVSIFFLTLRVRRS